MNTTLLNALAEPNRLRIVELLREHPRTVGEISRLLDMRQPQATKHLQALEKAGLAAVYPLGQRRIYALQVTPLKELRNWINTFKSNWENPHTLDAYLAAVKREQALAAKDASWADGRSVTMSRIFAASREQLWPYWTDPTEMKKWWSPDYMTTARAESEPWPGGRLRIDMADPDGAVHVATGHYTKLDKPGQIDFIMSPLDDKGQPAFEAHQSVLFRPISAEQTELKIHIRLAASTPQAAIFIAGIELGWNQTLNKLERALADAEGSETRM
jgi:uncharacterized protein YndB with AHSA1/START domain/DNA-binding transcriptional ArsR family regulator